MNLFSLTRRGAGSVSALFLLVFAAYWLTGLLPTVMLTETFYVRTICRRHLLQNRPSGTINISVFAELLPFSEITKRNQSAEMPLLLTHNYSQPANSAPTSQTITDFKGPQRAELSKADWDTMAISNYHKREYRLHMTAEPCSKTRIRFLIVVNTAPWRVSQRKAIRATWGHTDSLGNSSRLVFLMGQVKLKENQQQLEAAILDEYNMHGDLIQYGFHEEYRNLTLKSVLMLQWATTYCQSAQYLLKVDDDMWMNFGGVQQFLAKTPQKLTITGNAWKMPSVPQRPWRGGAYYMSKTMYPGRTYPTFVSGTTYVITMAAVPLLLKSCQSQPLYVYLEDVFVTGICSKDVKGMTIVSTEGFSQRKYSLNEDSVCYKLTAHRYNATDLHKTANRCQKLDVEYVAEIATCLALKTARRIPHKQQEINQHPHCKKWWEKKEFAGLISR